jgi:hypothetical protein
MRAARFALLAASLAGSAAHGQRPLGEAGRSAVRDVDVQGSAVRRQQLEQELRRGLWRIAKDRVGFTDEQMARLEETSSRFDGRRRVLVKEERAHRMALRDEILANDKADQDRVAKSLDRLLQLQRDRIDLQAEEQKEFATFMTPIQRAKYAALQEELRRRADALRRQRADTARGTNGP